MAPASGLRVGDADREATAAGLREHFAHGRLTLDEFNQRLNAVFAAKTDVDLARVTSDLPYVPAFGSGLAASSRSAGRSQGGRPQRSQRQDSWQQGSWRQATGQPGPQGRPRGSFLSGLIVTVLAIALIASLFTPYALFGFAASRPLVILLAVVTISRRIFRLFRGGGRARRRR